MKPFSQLTYLGQIRRLRKAASAALENYGLEGHSISFNRRSENTTFCITDTNCTTRSKTDLFHPGKYILRIHRLEHQTKSRLQSEMDWLHALRTEAGLAVPEPLPTLDGGWLSKADVDGLDEPRYCSILKWVKGRLTKKNTGLSHFKALGTLTARLHQHSRQWEPPKGFNRRSWDAEGLFGDKAGFQLPANQVWELLPQEHQEAFRFVAEQTRQVMADLGQGQENFGLIHADLTVGEEGNVIFHRGEARAIDFDDSGFGYWIYDFATSLCHWQLSPSWPKILKAFIDGYKEFLPLPENQLEHLNLFMAARHVSEILWGLDLAQTQPEFAEEIDGWLKITAENVELYLNR